METQRIMERTMMHTDGTILLEEDGGKLAAHSRFASRISGWLGMEIGVRRIATLLPAVQGSSVPSGRRLRS